MSGAEKSYADRVKINPGEDLFKQYCTAKNYEIRRIGFDEQEGFVSHFFDLNPLLRNLPDFVVNTGNETFVVCVKGTANLKKKEYDLLPLMIEWFSSKKAPLVYAFCFAGQDPKLVFPEKIIRLYTESKDQKWNDGIIYRNLAI